MLLGDWVKHYSIIIRDELYMSGEQRTIASNAAAAPELCMH